MKSEQDPRTTARASDGKPTAVTLRAMYADALRHVMADPRKALAEHDPRLAALLGCDRPAAADY